MMDLEGFTASQQETFAQLRRRYAEHGGDPITERQRHELSYLRHQYRHDHADTQKDAGASNQRDAGDECPESWDRLLRD